MQELITAISEGDFRDTVNLRFAAGWRIVPGTLCVTIASNDGDFRRPFERWAAVVEQVTASSIERTTTTASASPSFSY